MIGRGVWVPDCECECGIMCLGAWVLSYSKWLDGRGLVGHECYCVAAGFLVLLSGCCSVYIYRERVRLSNWSWTSTKLWTLRTPLLGVLCTQVAVQIALVSITLPKGTSFWGKKGFLPPEWSTGSAPHCHCLIKALRPWLIPDWISIYREIAVVVILAVAPVVVYPVVTYPCL